MPRRDNGPRRNEGIRAARVRVVGADGTLLGEFSLREALALAQEAELDLVEVAPGAVPVCRLQDFGREQFRAERARRAAQHKNVASQHVTEIQLRPAIGDHDLATKARTADRALAKGHRVRVVAVLHGRYVTRPELGQQLLQRFTALLTHAVSAETGPGSRGRVVIVLKPVAGSQGHSAAA